MAISIDWGTKEIFVPKIDTDLVQSSPVEIRQLNLNQFRLSLKDLEDNFDGMPYQRTHKHNTEVGLGGIIYARVIEMINGYTVTFENGAYAVNLIGANSNVGDVTNLNQVSVRSANAAGLISNAAIEYSSFNGGVTVDGINGVNGTVFPIGTPRVPVKTIQDAVLIAQFRGFSTLFIKGDLVLDTGDNVADYEIIGSATNKTFIQIADGAFVSGIEIKDATVEGIFDGKASFKQCVLLDISFVEAEMSECTLRGTITLDGIGNTIIEDCRDGLLLTSTSPTINFNGSGHNLAVRDYHGDLNIRNKTELGSVEINMNSGGRVTLEPTVTAGSLRLTGTLHLINNSTGAAIVNDSQVVYPDSLQLVAFNQEVHISSANGNVGTKFPIGTSQMPVSNITDAITIAQYRGITRFIVNGLLLVGGKNLNDYTLVGKEMTAVVVLIPNTGNSNNNTIFRDIAISGQLNGYIYADSCAVQELANIGSNDFPSVFSNCIIRGDDVANAISLRNGLITPQDVHFFNCLSAALDGEIITIDSNNSTTGLGFRNFAGDLKVINYTGGQQSTLTLSEGSLTLDPSNTNGTILAKADTLIDNSNGLVVTYIPSSGGGAGGTSDWSSSEKSQIRYALGVDGTKLAAVGGELQFLKAVLEGDIIPTEEQFQILDKLSKQVLISKTATTDNNTGLTKLEE
jgi:hypothetical protein